jgi:hypothetical protein
MHTSENYEIFKIHKDAERYTWVAYILFVILSSLVGDTLIVYASFQRDAFKLNKFIITVIRYIAISDLAYVIMSGIPRAVSLVADTWVLGSAMCYATTYTIHFSFSAGCYFIAILTSSKFLLLKFPLRSATWTRQMAHMVCNLSLIPILALLMITLAVDMNDVAFDYSNYVCRYAFNAEIWTQLLPILPIIAVFVPDIIIVVTTIMILKYAGKSARRVKTSVKWQGTLTVILTAAVYCISNLPLFIFHLGRRFVKQDPTNPFLLHFSRVAGAMSMINVMSNFYIYTLTIRSFRRFLRSKILSKFSNHRVNRRAVRKMTSTGEKSYFFGFIVRKGWRKNQICS